MERENDAAGGPYNCPRSSFSQIKEVDFGQMGHELSPVECSK